MNGQMLIEVCDTSSTNILFWFFFIMHYLNEAIVIDTCRCCVKNAPCFSR